MYALWSVGICVLYAHSQFFFLLLSFLFYFHWHSLSYNTTNGVNLLFFSRWMRSSCWSTSLSFFFLSIWYTLFYQRVAYYFSLNGIFFFAVFSFLFFFYTACLKCFMTLVWYKNTELGKIYYKGMNEQHSGNKKITKKRKKMKKKEKRKKM